MITSTDDVELDEYLNRPYDVDFEEAKNALEAISQDIRSNHPQDLQYWAKLHALYGPREFKQIFGLSEPRHRSEEMMRNLNRGDFDNDPDSVKQEFEDLEKLPLTGKLLDYLEEDIELKMVHFSKFLTTVFYAFTSERYLFDLSHESKASYHAREMRRKSSFFRSQLKNYFRQIAQYRCLTGKGCVEVGGVSAETAFDLILLVTNHVSTLWFRTCRIAENSQTDPKYLYTITATQAFCDANENTIPKPNELIARLREEITLTHLGLNNQLGQSIVVNAPPVHVQNNNSVEVNPIIQAASIVGTDQQAVKKAEDLDSGFEKTTPSTSKSKSQKDCHPNLGHWAVGMETLESWWLFRFVKGKWRQDGKVSIPSGHPAFIMELLASQEGAMSFEEARKRLCKSEKLMPLKQQSKRVTQALAKAKSATRNLIAKKLNCDPKVIGNLIPNDPSGWRSLIHVGYAIENDQGELEFKLKSELRE